MEQQALQQIIRIMCLSDNNLQFLSSHKMQKLCLKMQQDRQVLGDFQLSNKGGVNPRKNSDG